jgi:hypothetical protein
MKTSKGPKATPGEQLLARVHESDDYVDWFRDKGLWNQPKPRELEWLSDQRWRRLWLEIAYCLIESGRRGKANDFYKGLKRLIQRPRGRPSKLIDYGLVLKALADREDGKSWLQIARRHCPKRNEQDHRCTRDCADRFRLGVRRALAKLEIPLE